MSWLQLFAHDAREPLLFHSGTFFFLFSGFIAIYALLRRSHLARLLYVLLFSLFYYYKCNGLFMVTLLVTTAADYAIARQLHRQTSALARKGLVALSVTLSLSILGYFKYTNFLLETAAMLRGEPFEALPIFLPIGISFYTFQSISYVVDVYRGDVEPTESLLEYAFFLSFFPQIVAGPIVRARVLLPQIRAFSQPAAPQIAEGLYRIIQGLTKKALLADYVGQFSDIVFAAPHTYSGIEVMLAVYSYTLQIYFDFSGYSDMAIGMARIVGIELPENFNSPYRATSITDFWRRWHMSLSSWLRDYLYIPLGGNRSGKARQYVNLMLTMLLGGLWHGASWTFVVWGALHGIGLAVHKLFTRLWPVPKDRRAPLRSALGWIVTLHFVMALWVFFRAKDFSSAWLMFERMAADWELAKVMSVLEVRRWLLAALAIGFAVSVAPTRWATMLERRFATVPMLAKALVFVAVVQCVLQVKSAEIQPFIYFQF